MGRDKRETKGKALFRIYYRTANKAALNLGPQAIKEKRRAGDGME